MSSFESEQFRDAFCALALPTDASLKDIQKAWRRIAKESHPDREGGSIEVFLAAKSAYDYLNEELTAQQHAAPQNTPAKPSRPWDGSGASEQTVARERVTPRRPHDPSPPKQHFSRLNTKTEPLSPEILKVCQEALDESAMSAPVDGKQTAHLIKEVQRTGRNLVFVVLDELQEGLNRVAVPTGLLNGDRVAAPKVLKFNSKKTTAKVIELPDALRDQIFPGARSVSVKFGDIEEPVTA